MVVSAGEELARTEMHRKVVTLFKFYCANEENQAPLIKSIGFDDGFFPACEDLGGGEVIDSPPVFFFFFMGISSHTTIPLFRPGSVHSGSSS